MRRITVIRIPVVLTIFTLLLQSAIPWIVKSPTIQQRFDNFYCTIQKPNTRSSRLHCLDVNNHVHHLTNEKTTTSKFDRITSNIPLRDVSLSSTQHQQRRTVLHHLAISIAATGTALGFSVFDNASGAQETVDNDKTNKFRRETDEFRYEINIPTDMNGPNQKPLKTHYDEVNFKSTLGYEIGITVDPVRIQSLMEFGTPEEVAAKVVLAEVNRDGVSDVKLLNDPISGTVPLGDGSSTTATTSTYYLLNYSSNGKRGRKRYIAKFYIDHQKLFALTAQCKEDTYETIQKEMNDAVRSFRVL